MAAAPPVSIITPFKNVGPYLEEAVASVLAQDFGDWELLLVDDGSKDEGTEIARAHAARHPDRIRVLEHPGRANRGISASRNLGRRHARGRWLANLDGDDVWLPGKLSDQMLIVRDHPGVGLVFGASRYWRSWVEGVDAAGDEVVPVGAPPNSVVEPPRLLKLLYPLGPGAAPSMNTVLARADLVDRVGGWEDSFRTAYEDQAFLTKLYLVTPAFVSGSCWDLYRQRPGSSMDVDLNAAGYHAHRRRFLEWFEGYLSAQGLARTPVWRDLQRALLRYRHPMIYRAGRFGRRSLRRVAAAAGL